MNIATSHKLAPEIRSKPGTIIFFYGYFFFGGLYCALKQKSESQIVLTLPFTVT